MVEFTRRRALQAGLAAGAGALGGCVGLPSGTDRDPADRRISLDPSPSAGTWPRGPFDLGGTRHNPAASPPRSTPTVDWTASTSESAWVVVGPDNVYVDADGETIALSPDGSERWRAPVEGRLYYAAGRLYVATGDPGDPGPLVGLDPESGAEVWRSQPEIEIYDVVEARGTVYVAEDFSGVSEPGKLYGLHADTGAKRWQIEANERNPTFVVVDGRLAVVTTYGAATIDVSNRSTPTPEWTEFSMLTPSPSTATGCGDGSLFYGTTSAVVRYSYDEDEFEWRTGLDDWYVFTPRTQQQAQPELVKSSRCPGRLA